MFAPLRHRPFGRLLASYTVNQIGDYVAVVALALLVYDRTRDPLAVSALFVAMQFLPAFLAPALTARLDQSSLRRSLPALYLAEALLFGVLALLSQEFLLWAVLVVAFVDGVLMLAARGLLRGAVNDVLEPVGLLRQGNGLINVGFAAAFVGGSALGGVLVEVFSVTTALALDAASFLIVALILAAGRGLPEAHPEPVSFRERIAGGIAYVRSQPAIRLLLIGEGVAIVLFTLVVPIEVVYAKETLGTDDAGYGLLISSWGAGVVLGSAVFLGATRHSPRLLVLLSTLAIGVAYFGIGSVRVLWAACTLSVLGGLGNGVQWVSVMTALQEATPQDLQARVTGLLESIASGATGIGFLLGGLLAAATSPATAFHAAGAAVLVLTIGGFLIGARGPGLRRRSSGESPPAGRPHDMEAAARRP